GAGAGPVLRERVGRKLRAAPRDERSRGAAPSRLAPGDERGRGGLRVHRPVVLQAVVRARAGGVPPVREPRLAGRRGVEGLPGRTLKRGTPPQESARAAASR